MSHLKILLDSGCDITKEKAAQCNFDVVPLSICLTTETVTDYYDLDQEKFQALLTNGATIPTTAQPNPSVFLEYFERYQDDYENILMVTMSMHGSGTYGSAVLGKQMFEEKHPDSHCRIHLHDSLSTSYAEVLHAEVAHRMDEAGASIDEILKELDSIRHKTASYYIASDIPFLIKSGRVGNLKGAMVAKLGIKPIVSIVKGFGCNHAISMNYQGAVSKLASYFIREAAEDTMLYLTYFNVYDRALELEKRIRASVPSLRCEIHPMWGVMSTHAGPDSIGMFFFKK